ncbi:hypothetical protein SEUCBS140593_010327 [Sporothrix eucalyptigena]|uniref:cellulase n=1 Tax=Sporothrix eucalyptigena TaxID=1812306 RepID=A0ABP0D4Q5_9PEZI
MAAPSKGKFKWFGINQSCAEFGKVFPGTWGKDFTFPSTSSVQTHIKDGFNIFRVAFAMERLVPNTLTGSFDSAYLQNLTNTVNAITNAGAYAIVDPHNYGRYYGNIITDTNAFGTFWTNLAKKFASNPLVIFDTNNEYHEMDQTLVLNLNQAAITSIRSAGATSQYIFAEGNSWTGASTWNTTNTNLAALSDPQNKLVYEMHLYLDGDGSGSNETCVSGDIGLQRVIGATNWLRSNSKIGIIGEFAGGANTVCQTAITGLLNHLQANSDVWNGAVWWAGGPWWGDYIYSFEPPSGKAYTYYNSLLKVYTPGSTTPHAAAAPASLTTSSAAPSTTLSSAFIRYIGRVNPATKELSWPGTGVSFAFTGTSATIGLASVSGTNSVDLIINGSTPVVISNVAGTGISTPAGLSQGTHTVVLRKRSEPIYGSIFLGEITTDGALAAAAVPARQIEIIGDSITVGYGLDGTNPCTNNATVEDNPKTYGAMAANALGADYSVVAWSGKGLIRNIATGSTDTSPLMPELYTRYGANDADNSYPFSATWLPNAVVINLGTNDFSYIAWDASGRSYNARDSLDASAYTDGMVQFVQTIQTHYPDAHFFLLSSPMLSDFYPTAADAQKTTQTNALKNAATRLGAKVHFVDWPTQGSDVGCDYHPNVATHAAQGAVLANAIAAAVGW